MQWKMFIFFADSGCVVKHLQASWTRQPGGRSSRLEIVNSRSKIGFAVFTICRLSPSSYWASVSNYQDKTVQCMLSSTFKQSFVSLEIDPPYKFPGRHHTLILHYSFWKPTCNSYTRILKSLNNNYFSIYTSPLQVYCSLFAFDLLDLGNCRAQKQQSSCKDRQL